MTCSDDSPGAILEDTHTHTHRSAVCSPHFTPYVPPHFHTHHQHHSPANQKKSTHSQELLLNIIPKRITRARWQKSLWYPAHIPATFLLLLLLLLLLLQPHTSGVVVSLPPEPANPYRHSKDLPVCAQLTRVGGLQCVHKVDAHSYPISW